MKKHEISAALHDLFQDSEWSCQDWRSYWALHRDGQTKPDTTSTQGESRSYHPGGKCRRRLHLRQALASAHGLPAALEMLSYRLLTINSNDLLADTRTQNTIELPENAITHSEGNGNLVHGELITFTRPGFDHHPSTGWRHSMRMAAVFIRGFW